MTVFSILLQEFRGSVGIRNPFFWWFSLPFSKKKRGKEGQGKGDIRKCDSAVNFHMESLRVARLQNETAPEIFYIRYEKGFEKRERDPKNDPKRDRRICKAPLRPLKNISLTLF